MKNLTELLKANNQTNFITESNLTGEHTVNIKCIDALLENSNSTFAQNTIAARNQQNMKKLKEVS
jgi:hypothetical protein